MTMVSGSQPGRQQDIGGSNSGRHNQGRGTGRRGSLTCPSEGEGSPRSCVSGDTTPASQQHNEDSVEGSTVTTVVVRAPSPASSLASGVEAKAAAGRLWGDNATEATLPSGQQRGGDKGPGMRARAGRRMGKPVTWRQRKARRDTELADWLQTNTNLVNVCPW